MLAMLLMAAAVQTGSDDPIARETAELAQIVARHGRRSCQARGTAGAGCILHADGKPLSKCEIGVTDTVPAFKSPT